MRWTIDSKVVEKLGLSIDEFTLLLFLARRGDIQKGISSLIDKGLVEMSDTGNNQGKPVTPLEVIEKVQGVLLDSDNLVNDRPEYFDDLANKLREVFPKGIKTGTHYNWRGSTAEISRKLKNLVVKYGCKFTEEEAIDATKAYVASFNGDYKYMKLLKYFLLKTPINNNGDVEIESEFMTYLENKGAAEENNGNWTVDLA